MIPPITFDQRAQQLMADRQYPVVTAQEVEGLRNDTADDDGTRLTRLEAIARPRLDYKWQQAGGPIHGHELTPDELESARSYFEQLRLNRQSALHSETIMTTATIDSLIATYQIRRAEQQAVAEEQKKAKAAAALEHAKAVLAEKFGILWQYVTVVDVNVYLDHSRGTHSVRFNTLIDVCNCELLVDTNDKVCFVVGNKTFYHNQAWTENDWGEFFTTVRSVAVEQRKQRMDSHSYAIYCAKTDAQVRECIADALAEFPDEHLYYDNIADSRLAELSQRAEKFANERAQREADARAYEARRQAAEAEAIEAFKPFVAYQLHYAVEQPGDEDEPFTTETCYVLHKTPDADGYFQSIWRGVITKSEFAFVARTDLIEILSPDDDHAKRICQCDYEAGVYIRRTPDGAELLAVKSA